MGKSFLTVSIAIAMLIASKPQNERFSKYKAIEVYEVRPGVLALPRYSENGSLCEIDLERFKFLSGKIALGSLLTQDEIMESVNDLVPASERGPSIPDQNGTSWGGQSAVTFDEYEKISVKVYSSLSIKAEDLPPKPGMHFDVTDRVATIQWKQRKCR
jgi:hypothetical protein